MDPARQREIASMGGKIAHERGLAHEFDTREAVKYGRKGGIEVSKDRAHMAEIGRRGGRARKKKKDKEDELVGQFNEMARLPSVESKSPKRLKG